MGPPRLQYREAVMPKDALNPNPLRARGIVRKLQSSWGHASPHKLKRISADAEGPQYVIPDVAVDVANRREVCIAADKAPHLLVAGTFMASAFCVLCSWMMPSPCAPRALKNRSAITLTS